MITRQELFNKAWDFLVNHPEDVCKEEYFCGTKKCVISVLANPEKESILRNNNSGMIRVMLQDKENLEKELFGELEPPRSIYWDDSNSFFLQKLQDINDNEALSRYEDALIDLAREWNLKVPGEA